MMSGPHRNTTLRWTAAAVLPALVLVAFQAAWPWPFFSDDSFISLRYSDRLLNGFGLTWSNDSAGVPERVEGYSNLLWVVLTSGLGALGIELVTAARMLGGLCTALGLWWLAGAFRPDNAKGAAVAAVAPLLVASTQPVMIWTLAGLEGPLVFALLALGFKGLVRRYGDSERQVTFSRATLLTAGLPFAAVCWTRPDGPLWVLMAGTGIAVMSWPKGLGPAVQRAFFFGLPALLAVTVQMAFRLSYYGDYVPNTAHVKAEFDAASIGPGFAFVKNAMFAMPGLSVAAAIGTVLMLLPKRTRTFTLVMLLPVLAWLAYLTAIGGDHFPGLRLLHGALVPMALLAALAIRTLRNQSMQLVAAIVVAIGASWWNVEVARNDPRSHEARAERWEWHDKVLGETLKVAFAGPQPRIAIDSAGALPYYSKLPAIDMLGLCDRTIATTPFRDWLKTVKPGTPKPPGHLRGNGDYVIKQQPDLIVFKSVLPVFVSGCEMEDDPRFLKNYRLVRIDLNQPDVLPPGHRVPLWVRTEGVVGIQRTAQQVVIPAYLFGSFELPGPHINRWQPPGTDQAANNRSAANGALAFQFWTGAPVTAQPDHDGALQLRLQQGGKATLPISLPTGTYRVRIEPENHGATLNVVAGGELRNGDITVANEATLTLELCAPNERPALLLRIVLDRTR